MGLFLYESVVFWSGQRKRKEKTSKEKKNTLFIPTNKEENNKHKAVCAF